MSTTVIRTSSKNQFNKIQKYLKNRRVRFTSCVENQSFSIILFSLTSEETTRLIQRMTKHFHLTPLHSAHIALAA
jgi:hypothetical protein